MNFCRSRVVALVVVGLVGCNSGGQTDGSDGTTAGTGSTTSPIPGSSTGTGADEVPTTASPEPTSTGSSTDGPSTTTSSTTGPTEGETGPGETGPMDTGTDTGTQGLTCPLGDEQGAEQLVLAPLLFGAGDDPSGAAVCKFVNPDRGFHGYVDLRTLDGDSLDDVAADGLSVVYGYVLIPEYRNKPLDAALLDKVGASLDLVRMHGMKVVPRFHYSDDVGDPDAKLDVILGHIEQLKPLFEQHADVFLNLHAGFIGAYGEWHSSTNGLDAPGPRKQILDALLAALPDSRTISVRRPSFKDDAYGGPVTQANAYDGSALARLGHINDCFLASEDDEGTYQEPGEKDYAIADSAFVPVGGESCKVNPPRSSCPSALDELALLHWTHLNSVYHPGVLQAWKDEGCYGQIACRLGYRLAVTQLRWAADALPGGTMPVSVELINDGFAAPVNARPLVVVFDGPTRVEVAVPGFDLRTVQPNTPTTVCVDAALPADLPAGMYSIGLRLADAAPTLAEDPRQAIRLSNDAGVEWDEGVNWFAASFVVP